MKYIKTFESISEYKVDIFDIKEASDFFDKFGRTHQKYNITSKIRYFDYSDFSYYSASKEFIETCRFIISYNDNDILGVCKFAYWPNSENYSISYLSTNDDFTRMGVSKRILEKMFEYFSKTYPDETLVLTGYSVEGWMYLRKHILEFSSKYNVKIREKGIQYPGRGGNFSDEDRELMYKSKDEVESIYGKDDWY